MPLALSSSIFIAAIGQSLCYGVYTLIFGASLYTLFLKPSNRITAALLFTSILLFILITLTWIFETLRAAQGFLVYSGLETELFFADVSEWRGLARTLLSEAAILIYDCVMIYRCWIIWSRKWQILVVPIMMEAAYLSMAIYTATIEAQTGIDDGTFSTLNSTYDALMVILLCQNVYLTSCIVWKLWHVYDMMAEYRTGKQLLALAKTVARSGTLFSATCVVNATVAYGDTTVANIVADLLAPITGISFALMIIGSGPGLLDSHASERTSPTYKTSGISSGERQKFPVDSVKVDIRRNIDIEQPDDKLDSVTSIDDLNS